MAQKPPDRPLPGEKAAYALASLLSRIIQIHERKIAVLSAMIGDFITSETGTR